MVGLNEGARDQYQIFNFQLPILNRSDSAGGHCNDFHRLTIGRLTANRSAKGWRTPIENREMKICYLLFG
jgi:hypothetical protein